MVAETEEVNLTTAAPLTLLLPLSPDMMNRTYKLCGRAGNQPWRKLGFLFLPARDPVDDGQVRYLATAVRPRVKDREQGGHSEELSNEIDTGEARTIGENSINNHDALKGKLLLDFVGSHIPIT